MTRRPPAVVAVLGSGSWGTTFAKVLADAGESADTQVRLGARRGEIADEINTHHTTSRYLAETVLPDNISCSTDTAAVLDGVELEVIAVPAQSLRSQLSAWKPLISPDAVVVSLMMSNRTKSKVVISDRLRLPRIRKIT